MKKTIVYKSHVATAAISTITITSTITALLLLMTYYFHITNDDLTSTVCLNNCNLD